MSEEHHARRVVTGHDADGLAIVVSDDVVEFPGGGNGTFATRVWSTVEFPADNTDGRDGAEILESVVAAGGTVCYICDWPPRGVFPMHRSATVDYLTVLDGEFEAELDGGETVRLRKGDALVQRGTNHVWRNPTDEWCRTVVTMVAAKPIVVDGSALPATLV